MSWRTARSEAFVGRLGDASPLIRIAAFNNVRRMTGNDRSAYSHGLLTMDHLTSITTAALAESNAKASAAARECLWHIALQGRHKGLREGALHCLVELGDAAAAGSAGLECSPAIARKATEKLLNVSARSLLPKALLDLESNHAITMAPWHLMRDEARAVYALIASQSSSITDPPLATMQDWVRAGGSRKLYRKLQTYEKSSLQTNPRAEVAKLWCERLQGGGLLVKVEDETVSPLRKEGKELEGVTLRQWEFYLQDACTERGEEAANWLGGTLAALRGNLTSDRVIEPVSWDGEGESFDTVWATYSLEVKALYIELATRKQTHHSQEEAAGAATPRGHAAVLGQEDLVESGFSRKFLRYMKQYSLDGPILLEQWTECLRGLFLAQADATQAEAWIQNLMQSSRLNPTLLPEERRVLTWEGEEDPSRVWDAWRDQADAAFALMAKQDPAGCSLHAGTGVSRDGLINAGGTDLIYRRLDRSGAGAATLPDWRRFLSAACRSEGPSAEVWIEEFLATIQRNLTPATANTTAADHPHREVSWVEPPEQTWEAWREESEAIYALICLLAPCTPGAGSTMRRVELLQAGATPKLFRKILSCQRNEEVQDGANADVSLAAWNGFFLAACREKGAQADDYMHTTLIQGFRANLEAGALRVVVDWAGEELPELVWGAWEAEAESVYHLVALQELPSLPARQIKGPVRMDLDALLCAGGTLALYRKLRSYDHGEGGHGSDGVSLAQWQRFLREFCLLRKAEAEPWLHRVLGDFRHNVRALSGAEWKEVDLAWEGC